MLTLFNYKTVHLEISSKCTLKCPRCPRTELDIDRVNQEISLREFQTGFPKHVLEQIDVLVFCGDLGDPIYATEFLDMVQYIKQNSQTRLRITTNGSYKKLDWWRHLGSMLDHNDLVTFSVDGWDHDSNNLYRINSDFESIIGGIQSLRIASRCCIRWSTIYFAFNQDRMLQIKELARSLGCDQFQTVKSSKFDGRYLVNHQDTLKPLENFVAPTAVYQIHTEMLTKHPYETTSLPDPAKPHAWAKCLNYKKELFVGVDGLVAPCPWFNNGYQDNCFVRQHQQRLSIKHRSFFDILDDNELWQVLLKTFDTEPLEICKIKCKHG